MPPDLQPCLAKRLAPTTVHHGQAVEERAEYFSFGYTRQADQAVHHHVAARARRFLCRRHKLRVSGTSQFGYVEIFGKSGVIDLHQRRQQRGPVNALS